MPPIHGHDVAHYQNAPSNKPGSTPVWQILHDSNPGLKFNAAKATQGNYRVDPEFHANWSAMRSFDDWCRIAYHFLDDMVKPTEQAMYFRRAVGSEFGPRDGVMLDVETVPGDIGPVSANFLAAALDAIEQEFQRPCICYIGQFYANNVDMDPRVAARPWWLPWYTKRGERPNWARTPTIWQWTSTARVPGIAGNVDANELILPLGLLAACAWPTSTPGTPAPTPPRPELPSMDTPDFQPSLKLAPIVDQMTPPSGQGVWLLGEDGGVYTFGGAPYLGGPIGKPYWAGRTAKCFAVPNDAERAAGCQYVVMSTRGERYGYPGV